MEIKNKKVLLRADFNVPIIAGVIKDNYRIVSTIPTMQILKDAGSKTIIISHIETKDVDKPTLKPVFDYIKNNYPDLNIEFIDNAALLEDSLNNLNPGGFLLLENIRNFNGEKSNDSVLAENFKSLTDVYVNDAFAVSHRNHMSVSALPMMYDKEHKTFGLQMKKEIDDLSKVLNPVKPTAVILSGAKFSTKLPLIEKYLNTADKLFIGGALFNNVLKSLKHNIGKSLTDDNAEYLDTLVKTQNFIYKIFIPKNIVVKDLNTGAIRTCDINDVGENESILDIAESSILEFMDIIKKDNYKTIVWNGPLGNYEEDAFKVGTTTLAKELVSYMNINQVAHLFIGGGDTVAATNSMDIKNERILVSTGGGAMLEFLEKDGKLPGILSVTNI